MKVDLSTTYMGIPLRNPFIASSSGMTDSVEKIKKLYEDGIAAVVLKSIFEEQILREIDSLGVNNMYGSFQDAENYVSFYTREHNLGNYIQLIKTAKKEVPIPVIASISCISDNEWVDYAKKIEEAGADAIELNMFILPSDPEINGRQIEQVYFDVINHILSQVSIPVSVKLSSYFSGMADTLIQISNSGIKGMVLFNRFFTPDIDLENEKVISANLYSDREENGNTLRWISILANKVSCSLVASTGIHDGETAIKNLLAGANALQIASVLYQKSSSHISEMLKDIENWMVSKKYTSLKEIIGKLSAKNIKKPMLYERAQFMKYYSNHY
jgi:dihydroorotate dehydrogenase (fumarate)